MDTSQNRHFWIFQYTNGTRTDRLLKSGNTGDDINWLWSAKLTQTPEKGDIVFFLRSGEQEKNYPPDRPWRGITGFGQVSDFPVTLENAQSDTGVKVETLEGFRDDPLPDYSFWHDHRLARPTVLFGQRGTNFLIREPEAAALVDEMSEPEVNWTPTERVASHKFVQSLSFHEDKDELTAEIDRRKAWVNEDVAVSLHLARALSERSTGRGWMTWTLLFMGLILRIHGYPGNRKPSRLAAALLDIAAPDGDLSRLHRLYNTFTSGDVDPLKLRRQDAGAIENLSERSSVCLSQARNFAGDALISMDALIAGLLNTHADPDAYVPLFDCDKDKLIKRLVENAFDENNPREINVFLDWLNRRDLAQPPSIVDDSGPDITDKESLDTRARDGAGVDDQEQLASAGEPDYPTRDIIQTAGAITDDAKREDDFLDVAHEASAFARLIASKNFEPPIAIGVFGHWGSGKSYFMNKIEAELKELTGENGPETEEPSKADDTNFHGNIVRIPFNAWHYMETNVWASLVDVIFKSLDGWLRDRISKDENPEDIDAIFDSLSTAHVLRLDAIEHLAARLQAQEAARQALASANESRLNYWGVVAGTFLQDQTGKKQFETAIDTFGLKDLNSEAEKLKTAIVQAKEAKSQADLIWKALRLRISRPWILVLLAGVTLVVPVIAINIASALDLSELAAAATALTTTVTGWLSFVTQRAKKGVTALNSLKSAFDAAEKKRADDQKDTMSEFDANVESAEAQLTFAENAVAEAQRNLLNNSAAGRIAAFIRARAEGDSYSRHLGIIDMIRRDFEQLTVLMANARSEGDDEQKAFNKRRNELIAQIKTRVKTVKSRYTIEDPVGENTKHRDTVFEPVRTALEDIESSLKKDPNLKTTFDRIVLFIDDLDRCPPDKVYEVLQAIHLFLCFPLFVVVVGVDTRWMETSLETELDKLVDGSSGASAQDYLEKIFQIPYWTRRMNGDAASSFVSQLVARAQIKPNANGDNDEQQDENSAGATGPNSNPAFSGVSEEQMDDVVSGQEDNTPARDVDQPSGELERGETPAKVKTEKSAEEDDEGQPDDRTESPDGEKNKVVTKPVKLTDAEKTILEQFAPFAGNSPRKLLRFVNVYGLIKSVSDTADEDDVPKDKSRTTLDLENQPLQVRALIFQLAIATGDPNTAKFYFEALETSKALSDLKTPAVPQSSGCGASRRQSQTIAEMMGAAVQGLTEDDKVEQFYINLKATAPIARRYTFASPDAIQREANDQSKEPPNDEQRQSKT